jgi:acetolactate synthase-1/2/3 large subunit
MRSVADVVVHRLLDAGVRSLFGVPGGGGNLDLIDAAGRAGLPFVLTATEVAGAIAAIAQAEITGAPGACLTTIGPGAASVVNGVACARLERVPLLVFTDALSAADGARFEHQRLDHERLLSAVAKASTSLRAAGAEAQMDDAVALAAAPMPGPVHVDCPGEVLRRPAAEAGTRGYQPARFTGGSIEGALRAGAAARHPLIIAGLGARRPADADAIRRFCERERVPAMVTYKAKGVVPDDHPWFAGVFTNGAIEQPLLEMSDLILAIGLDPVELLPRPWRATALTLHLAPWPAGTTHVPFAEELLGEVPDLLAALAPALRGSDWQGDVEPHRARQRAAVALPAAGFTPSDVVDVCAAACAAQARVTVDAGAHMFPATLRWPVRAPGDLLISNGLSTMGFALPAAIGAALLDRDRPVLALTGDGGLLMCAGELATAARQRLRIIVVVFNDASLSLIDIKQRARKLAPAGVALGPVAWADVARGFGVAAHAADGPGTLTSALDAALRTDGPSLIDVHIDGSRYGDMFAVLRG